MSLTPRDTRTTQAVISEDLITLLDTDPEAFDVLIFKAIVGSEENPVLDYVEDVVTAIDSDERDLDYADPVQSRAMIISSPDRNERPFSDGTGENIFGTEEEYVLLIKEFPVPKYSVVQWVEQDGPLDTDVKDVQMMVMGEWAFGRAPISGVRYMCRPITANEVPDND